jgi:Ni/Co efflux regulator RcnB
MRRICRFSIFIFILASALMFAARAQAQDEPSLGDVARKTRQQKQQKDVPAKDAQSPDSQNKDGQNKDVQSKGVSHKDSQSVDAQSKGTPSKDAQLHRTSHVITDDEIPQYPVSGVKTPASPTSHVEFAPDPAFGGKMSPDAIRSQIQDQKSGISALQAQITELNGSIHFAGANCVANCALWNDSQQQKQRQVEDMRSELENAKQALEQMQDYARKMGFGSSVYDPEQ